MIYEANQPSFSIRAAGCFISRFYKPSQGKHCVHQPDHQGGGQVGQEEQDEAHDQHTAREGVEAFAFQRHLGSLCMALMFAR